jgi:hypothetical protein
MHEIANSTTEAHMNGDFCIKRQGMTIGLFVLALSAGGALAADLGNVTITHDQDVAARTNMQRSSTDTSTLGVTFDAGVAQRTNMQRQPGDVAPVKVIKDSAVMERTNMGDIARTKPAEPPVQTSINTPVQTSNK